MKFLNLWDWIIAVSSECNSQTPEDHEIMFWRSKCIADLAKTSVGVVSFYSIMILYSFIFWELYVANIFIHCLIQDL
jgi:hypothetical protein